MQLFTGTSGFAYKEWKGSFYPEELRNDEMLRYYAAHFRACEINNSFYRVPTEQTLLQWCEQVTPEFRFILKAPQKITHFTRLKPEAREPLEYFLTVAHALGSRMGPILFQLPPNMKADVPRLAAFLELLPEEVRAAFEFRHPSWFADATYDTLRASGAALCIADTEQLAPPRVITSAAWGYLRLRRVTYEPADIGAWAQWLAAQPWQEAYVFFKHEDAGTGPRLARQFEQSFAAVAL